MASTPIGFQETPTVLRSPHFLLNIQSLCGESEGDPHPLLPPPLNLTLGNISLCVHSCSRKQYGQQDGVGREGPQLIQTLGFLTSLDTLHTHLF